MHLQPTTAVVQVWSDLHLSPCITLECSTMEAGRYFMKHTVKIKVGAGSMELFPDQVDALVTDLLRHV